MPVIFNEPLSFLQRLAEYMEHTFLVHQANTCSDSVERIKVVKQLANDWGPPKPAASHVNCVFFCCLQCVAAFAVSAVASQWERTGKPFNPLLGETYELVRWVGSYNDNRPITLIKHDLIHGNTWTRACFREDLGFRLISEQVSHHPPVSAFHAEGLKNDFVFHGSIYPKLKFWGKSVEAEPKGIITLELPKYGKERNWVPRENNQHYGSLVCSAGTMKSTRGQILHVAFTTLSWVTCGLSSTGTWKWSTTGEKKTQQWTQQNLLCDSCENTDTEVHTQLLRIFWIQLMSSADKHETTQLSCCLSS